MAVSTIIHQFNTDRPYKMEVLCNLLCGEYILSFTSMDPRVCHSQEVTCKSFGEVMEKYRANCRYYNVPEPSRITEEEFLGVDPGFLFGKKEAAV